jgi:hypothetical protein
MLKFVDSKTQQSQLTLDISNNSCGADHTACPKQGILLMSIILVENHTVHKK